MKYECPNCNSHDVKKLSLIYEQGISTVSLKTESTSIGAGLLSGDLGAGITSSSGTSSGFQKSMLSQRIAPPSKKYLTLPIHPDWRGEKLLVFGMLFSVFGAPVVWFFGWAGYLNTVGISVALMIFGWLLRFTMSRDEVAARAEKCKEVDAERAAILEAHSLSDDPFETWNRSFMCLRCGSQFDPTRQQQLEM